MRERLDDLVSVGMGLSIGLRGGQVRLRVERDDCGCVDINSRRVARATGGDISPLSINSRRVDQDVRAVDCPPLAFMVGEAVGEIEPAERRGDNDPLLVLRVWGGGRIGG